MTSAKPKIEHRQQELLDERSDLSHRAAVGATMSGAKLLQDGVRVKLSSGMTWDKLATMSPDEIRSKDLFPKEFLPVPHPNQPECGMVFRTLKSTSPISFFPSSRRQSI
jgi:hypothetical protein